MGLPVASMLFQGPDLPPGTGPTRDFSGPWFSTQLILSSTLGCVSFLAFLLIRTRFPRVYMGRLSAGLASNTGTGTGTGNGIRNGHVPEQEHDEEEDHADEEEQPSIKTPHVSLDRNYNTTSVLGWVKPLLRMEEEEVLDQVGLDAVILLSFLRYSFYFFTLAAIAAIIVLMPLHFFKNGSTDSDSGDLPGAPSNGTDTDGDDSMMSTSSAWASYLMDVNTMRSGSAYNHTIGKTPPTLLDLIIDPQTTLSLHLLFTYFFSLLALFVLNRTYHRFLHYRQTFQLNRRASIPARTCLITNIPPLLRSDQALTDYFQEKCGWKVESAMVVLQIGKELREALKERDEALRGLERGWGRWVGEKKGGRIRLEEEDENGDPSRDGLNQYEENGNGEDGSPQAEPDMSATDRPTIAPAKSYYQDDVAPGWDELPRQPPTSRSLLPITSTTTSRSDSLSPSPTAYRRPSAPQTPHGTHQKPRPMIRIASGFVQHVFKPFLGQKVDAIDYYQDKFDAVDAKVKVLRRKHAKDGRRGLFEDVDGAVTLAEEDETGITEDHETHSGDNNRDQTEAMQDTYKGHVEWTPTGEAFVTFVNITDAELAAQVVHFPEHGQCKTRLAPDNEDIVWENMGLSVRERWVRTLMIRTLVLLGLLFWAAPVSALASLLSFKSIQKVAPWLARIIDDSPAIGALVQTTLPSSALIIFNAVVPFVMEYLCYWQGFRSKSAIETSLLRKYTLFLLFTVILVFLVATTAYALFVDLAGDPQKIPHKLAEAFTKSNARAFAMSYVMLSGLGLMPLQLLNLGTVFIIGLYRVLFTRTPRDMVELYTPPAINYGFVYPPAILIFIISLLYSVLSPLILIFAAIYFATTYLVYKYKLLYVFVNPYESTGAAWPTTFVRLIWGVILFQTFMAGLFAVRGSVFASTGMIPLLLATAVWSWTIREEMKGLSQHTPLSSIANAEETLLSDTQSISLRYNTRMTPAKAYSQKELSETLPKPWVVR